MAATRATSVRRRTRTSQPAVLEDLKKMVDALLKENRALKRQVEKLAAAGVAARPGRRANPLATGLAGLQRKLQRALDGSTTASSRRAASRRRTAAATTRTRKPVSPEVREKRLQALAKARAARAAKKAAQS